MIYPTAILIGNYLKLKMAKVIENEDGELEYSDLGIEYTQENRYRWTF